MGCAISALRAADRLEYSTQRIGLAFCRTAASLHGDKLFSTIVLCLLIDEQRESKVGGFAAHVVVDILHTYRTISHPS